MTTHSRRRRRLATLASTAVAAAALQSALAAPADAGQVGVTISIKGAGKVTVVEGSLEDGGNQVCDWTSNQDTRVTNTCARLRNQEPLEAWVWLRAEAATAPANQWAFEGWTGCDALRDRDGKTECAVHSGAFTSDERTPKAYFRDRVAPTVTSAGAQQLTTSNRRFRFSFAADDGATECRLLSASDAFEPCTSPTDHTVRWGDDKLLVRAVDPSGNVSAVREVAVVGVDTLLYPGPGSTTRSRTARFDYQGIPGGEFFCSLDFAAYTSCGTGEMGSVTYTDLPDASHSFRVYARKGDFVDTHPSSYEWRVDTVAPATPVTAQVDGGTASFTFPATNTVLQECRLAGPGRTAAWAKCVSPVAYDGLADGDYTFELRSTDPAGNVEAPPFRHTWAVDRAAPETTTTGPTGFVLGGATTVGLAASEAGSTFACTLDGAARGCAAPALTLDGLEAGTHVVTAAATDPRGNADRTPAVQAWTVPVAAGELAKAKGWKTKQSAAAYGGSYLQAKWKGATLTRSVVDARAVALVVGKGRKLGKVKVYAGSRLLGTVRLAAGSSSTRQLVTFAPFSEPFTGSVRIVVATKDRQVRIEGLGVATR